MEAGGKMIISELIERWIIFQALFISPWTPIIATNPFTGAMGAATATALAAVGGFVLHARFGAGGDYRGTHSAALKISCFDKPPLDLRID
jgi:uncharacterized Ntn-hydrolase superfamily protein